MSQPNWRTVLSQYLSWIKNGFNNGFKNGYTIRLSTYLSWSDRKLQRKIQRKQFPRFEHKRQISGSSGFLTWVCGMTAADGIVGNTLQV